ncbi:MAG: precorrin-8X methylmutase [Magnetovibrio sp.]|nr:precorrin-8X methylmutase [Magnetovibrio sp.]
MFQYIRNPNEIYRRSFEILRRECNFSRLPNEIRPIAERLVHACGIPEILENIAWGGLPAETARTALNNGANILVDAEMVGAGIMKKKLPKKNAVICTLNDPNTPKIAADKLNTRSAAAVDLWTNDIENSLVVFGNAPTALYRMLELLSDGAPKPAAIFAFPVGFIGATESKEALIEHAGSTPYITLRGRLGGSAMAAAAVNALLLGRQR